MARPYEGPCQGSYRLTGYLFVRDTIVLVPGIFLYCEGLGSQEEMGLDLFTSSTNLARRLNQYSVLRANQCLAVWFEFLHFQKIPHVPHIPLAPANVGDCH